MSEGTPERRSLGVLLSAFSTTCLRSLMQNGVLLTLRWVEGGYLTVHEATAEEIAQVEPFEEVELDVDVLLDRKET